MQSVWGLAAGHMWYCVHIHGCLNLSMGEKLEQYLGLSPWLEDQRSMRAHESQQDFNNILMTSGESPVTLVNHSDAHAGGVRPWLRNAMRSSVASPDPHA